jgi:DNA-binding protein H-NS
MTGTTKNRKRRTTRVTKKETKSAGRAAERHPDLRTMSVADLWALHERVGGVLAARLRQQISALDGRLAVLKIAPAAAADLPMPPPRAKRFYPPVRPKYRNPSDRSMTWSGRGKRPRWMQDAMKADRRLTVDHFRIR